MFLNCSTLEQLVGIRQEIIWNNPKFKFSDQPKEKEAYTFLVVPLIIIKISENAQLKTGNVKPHLPLK